jgi:hypothetical protein
LGATKPQLLPTHSPVLAAWFGDHTHANGNDYSTILAGDANNSVATNTSVGFGAADDTSLTRIAALPGYVATYSITTQAAGDEVFSIVVDPFSPIDVGSNLTVYSPAGFVGLAFQRFRGTVRYCVEFVSTGFQRATVLLSHSPTLSSSTLTDAQQYNNSQTIVVDGSRCVEFDIPWVSQITHIARDQIPDRVGLGYLLLHVVNPVVTNQSQPGCVYVNVTVKLLDAEFVRLDPPLNRWVYQLESATDAQPCAELAFGERFESVNQLTRLYLNCGLAQYNNGNGWDGDDGGGTYDLRIPADPTQFPATSVVRALHRSMLPVWGAAFYGYRGSLRWKVLSPAANPGAQRGALAFSELMGAYQPYQYTANSFSDYTGNHSVWLRPFSGGAIHVLLDTQHNLFHEVAVPNNQPLPYSSFMSLLIEDDVDDVVQTVRFYGVVPFPSPTLNALSDAAPQIPIFVAGGDDFELFDFMWVPQVHKDP